MTLRQYWTVLWEDRYLVGVVVALCVAIGVVVAVLLPKQYSSQAVFYVAATQGGTSSTDSYNGAQLSTERVKSYSELVAGERVAADASVLLGGQLTPDQVQRSIRSDAVSETVVLDLEVTGRSPQEAQRVGTAVTLAFTRLVRSIESTGQPTGQPIVTTQVVLAPTLPQNPSGPGLVTLGAAGLVLGVLLGIGLALARRAMRRTIDNADGLETRLGAPVLASIPGLRRRPRRPALLTEPAAGNRSADRKLRARAESVRRLRAAVRAAAPDASTLVITGVRSGHGTTTVASDLAIALAVTGDSVVLVEADLRLPTLAETFGLESAPGFGDVLAGRASLTATVQRWGAGNLDIITAGAARAHPGELLGSPDISSTLRELAARYDRVILDTPSVSSSADAADLARYADGALLVCRRGATGPDDVDTGAAVLRMTGVDIVGAVLTYAADVPEPPQAVADPNTVRYDLGGLPVPAPDPIVTPHPSAPPAVPPAAAPSGRATEVTVPERNPFEAPVGSAPGYPWATGAPWSAFRPPENTIGSYSVHPGTVRPGTVRPGAIRPASGNGGSRTGNGADHH